MSRQSIVADFSSFMGKLRDHTNSKLDVIALDRGVQVYVSVAVVPSKWENRPTEINSRGEFIKSPNDKELALCSNLITNALSGTHLKCKKCYQQKSGEIVYYINPDWDYHNAQKGSEDESQVRC